MTALRCEAYALVEEVYEREADPEGNAQRLLEIENRLAEIDDNISKGKT